MNREIKFRAWDDSDNTMWFSPSISEPHHLGSWLEAHSRYGYAKVESSVFMQYTGLKDKNGKEIYEGDILSVEPLLIVVFEDGGFCFKNEDHNSGADRLSRERVSRLVIIGNIYENRELL